MDISGSAPGNAAEESEVQSEVLLARVEQDAANFNGQCDVRNFISQQTQNLHSMQSHYLIVS